MMKAGILVGGLAVLAACASGTSFISSWRAPETGPLNFKGKKVAALVMSQEEGSRYGAEAELARQITAAGAQGIPAYSLIPKEITRDKDKAKAFLEKANIAGVVVMRVVGQNQEYTSSPSTYYSGPYYATFWGGGYYGYGWGGVYDPGYLRTDTVFQVETLVYSLEQDKLVWAGRSKTTNPKDVNSFVKALAQGAVSEMKKTGLIK